MHSNKKTVVFQHRVSGNSNDIVEEEFEFEHDATVEEIEKEYTEWVWSRIAEDFSYYEKK
ncbi:hypothetical protein ACFYU8_17730 [Brevibacillus sp. NPDC003359]|uniref:hypothetical protein n=1 Tax=unclassified Brevibacillus TaxID=2684853 RepID=UPI00367B7E1C